MAADNSFWNKFSYSIRALFRRDKTEKELDTELRFHLESQIENNIRAGMSPEAARQSAMREFGGVERKRIGSGLEIEGHAEFQHEFLALRQCG